MKKLIAVALMLTVLVCACAAMAAEAEKILEKEGLMAPNKTEELHEV